MSARWGWFGAQAGWSWTLPTISSPSRATRKIARGTAVETAFRHQASARSMGRGARKLTAAPDSTASARSRARSR